MRPAPIEVRVLLMPEPSAEHRATTVASDSVAVERAREFFADGAALVRCHRTETKQADRKWTWTRGQYERGEVR
jgi:hypothetical protein